MVCTVNIVQHLPYHTEPCWDLSVCPLLNCAQLICTNCQHWMVYHALCSCAKYVTLRIVCFLWYAVWPDRDGIPCIEVIYNFEVIYDFVRTVCFYWYAVWPDRDLESPERPQIALPAEGWCMTKVRKERKPKMLFFFALDYHQHHFSSSFSSSSQCVVEGEASYNWHRLTDEETALLCQL